MRCFTSSPETQTQLPPASLASYDFPIEESLRFRSPTIEFKQSISLHTTKPSRTGDVANPSVYQHLQKGSPIEAPAHYLGISIQHPLFTGQVFKFDRPVRALRAGGSELDHGLTAEVLAGLQAGGTCI